MNRTKQLFIGLLLLSGICMSCSMDENMEPVRPGLPSGEAFPDSVYFILEDPTPLTRVTYAGDGLHADFEKEDLVGCFALNDDLTSAEGDGFKPNACYRVSVHTNITTGEDRRFLSPVTAEDDINKTADRYLFYYPYDSKITSLDQLNAYIHSVNTDQNDRDRYEASDLLWVRYYKNQPWSFTDTLLCGFYCDLDGDDTVTLDTSELKEAHWLSREELPPRQNEASLTAEMMERFRLGEEC